MFWYDLTWDEINALDKENVVVILPIGSCEQHSLHLPLGMDTYSVIHMSKDLVNKFGDKIVVLPPLWFGASEHHMDFAGTITLSNETLINVIKDIVKSVIKHGFKKILILNGHGGNTDPVKIALRELRVEKNVMVELVNPWTLANKEIKETLESEIWGHACEFETSEAMYIIPDKVRQEKIRDPNLDIDMWNKIKERNIPWHTKDLSDTGSLGYPTKANREKGEKLYNIMLEKVSEIIEEIQGK